MLSDGVAYAQIIHAIHPGGFNINRLNLNIKYPDDCVRNVKLIEDALKHLKINQAFNF
jgi:hypothetical protein